VSPDGRAIVHVCDAHARFCLDEYASHPEVEILQGWTTRPLVIEGTPNTTKGTQAMTTPRYDAQNIERISRETAFDHGDLFESEDQVRAYFTTANMVAMFGEDALPTQPELDDMARMVIANRWHCSF
jgi:hypothetical protein